MSMRREAEFGVYVSKEFGKVGFDVGKDRITMQILGLGVSGTEERG